MIVPVADPSIGVTGRAAPPRPPTNNFGSPRTEILNYTSFTAIAIL